MEKINKKEYKVNINYLELVKELLNSKIEVSKANKELIEKKYNEIVNLKFSNLNRVSYRNNRKEVIEKRNKYLLSELKVSEKDYNRVDKKLNIVSKERLVNRYI